MILSLISDTSRSFAKRHQDGKGHMLSAHSMLCFRIPRYMDDGLVRLRPLRISDIPSMYNKLQDRDILKAIGLTRPSTASWLHLWWWLRKTLILRYALEADSRLMGFMGLHHLMPGISAELTLVIADKKSRGLGHGTRAFTLLAQNLRRYSSTQQLIVKVKPDNKAACSFWSKLDFETHGDHNGLQVMSITTGSLHKQP